MARLAVKVKSRTAGGSSAKKERRTNAERSESTRERVLAAAIKILHTRGYSGATTLAVQEAAGISLGALQHQFPTKAKLMAAVGERFSAHRLACYAEAAGAAATPLEAIKRMLDVTADIIRDPEFVSGLEILLAKRNDPELEAEVRPIIKHYEDQIRGILDKIMTDAGVDESVWNSRAVVLSNAVARGLAVELLSGGDRATVVGAFAIWRDMALEAFIQGMNRSRRGSAKG